MHQHANYKELRKAELNRRQIALREQLELSHLFKSLKVWFSVIAFCVLVWALLLRGTPLFADCLNDKDCILAVIGESENQGYEGLLATSCAIRNRGTLHGVFGTHSPRVIQKRYSQKTYLLAKKAWETSLKIDTVNGANSWENIKQFGKPYWADSCKVTKTIKDHVFMKC